MAPVLHCPAVGPIACRSTAGAEGIRQAYRLAEQHFDAKGVNRVILCHALGLELRYMERIAQRHAALNIIEFLEEDVVVQLLNG